MSRPPLNIGLIGAGGSAWHHLSGFVHSGLVRRVTLAEPDDELRTALRGRYGLIKADSADPQAMLSDPDVQLVDVCGPLAQRAAMARLALSAGKHVLLDLPPAGTVAEFDELVALADERGLRLLCPLTRLYLPAHVKLDQLRQREQLPAPLIATALQAAPPSAHPEDDLVTAAYHVLYALEHYAGPAREVVGASIGPKTLSAMLVLGEDVTAQLAVMRSAEGERPWGERRLMGEGGYVWLRDNPEDEMSLLVALGEDFMPVKVAAPPDAYEYAAVRAVQAALKALATGTSSGPLTPARTALSAFEAVQAAARNRCAVPLNPEP